MIVVGTTIFAENDKERLAITHEYKKFKMAQVFGMGGTTYLSEEETLALAERVKKSLEEIP